MLVSMFALAVLVAQPAGYRYQDARGDVHMVERLEDVPSALRAKAVPIGGSVEVESAAQRAERESARDAEVRALQLQGAVIGLARRGERALHKLGWFGYVHLPSFGLGAGLVLIAAILFSFSRRSAGLGRGLKLASVAATAVSIAGGYGMWVRSATTGGPGPATPQSFIGEASKAADVVNEKQRQSAEALDALEAR
jgi:hypothetical protein